MSKKQQAQLNKSEIELYETKWHDYRRMSPDVATMKFMHAYAKAMRTYNDTLGRSAHFFILRRFESMKLVDLKQEAQFKALANLRRWADKYGMPYGLFWSYATEAHLKRKFDKTWIQAFACESIRSDVLKMWVEWRERTVVRSDDAYFKAANFKGYPIQRDYYDYLMDAIIRRYDWHEAHLRIERLIDDGELDSLYATNHLERRQKEAAA